MTDVVERHELIQPGPAQALAALLSVPLPDLDRGEPLPVCWHWLYLLDRPATADLGRDGHPVRGVDPAPPGPGLRRMWAGGRVEQRGGLVVGEPATRHSAVTARTDKQGRSGKLMFVEVTHTVSQGGEPVVIERQDIVYREMSSAAGDSVAAAIEDGPGLADGGWEIEVTPPLLFRFSALTYNGHRIHYDREYAREVEGYPGLVTHGPLQALVMAEAARAAGAPTRSVFDYRLVAPLFDHQGLVAYAAQAPERHVATTVTDRTGRVTARGTARAGAA
ncbi:MAG: MaoC family dehydratase N-terminal domain-containing protein [Micrococcales bacterium]|nr:MaoC family dehydratase N-terminal domain-containing protein [Micrococcales bacterium]